MQRFWVRAFTIVLSFSLLIVASGCTPDTGDSKTKVPVGSMEPVNSAPINPDATGNPDTTGNLDEVINPDNEVDPISGKVKIYEGDKLRLYADSITRDCEKPFIEVSNHNNNGFVILYVEPLTTTAQSVEDMVELNMVEMKINGEIVNISSSSTIPETGGPVQFYWFVDQQSERETKLESISMSFVVNYPDGTIESLDGIEILASDVPIIQAEVNHEVIEPEDKNQDGVVETAPVVETEPVA